jgi:hypothetical protein
MPDTRRSRPAVNAALSGALVVSVALTVAFLVSAMAGTGSWPMPGGGADGVLGSARSPGASQATLGTDADSLPAAADIRVEVLNGSGVGGLAREATHRLRGEGFDVVFFGNAPRFDFGRSVVLDRTGDLAAAGIVATALGIDSIASDVDPRLLLDVTVVLGRDWPPPVPEVIIPLGRLRRLVAPADTVR